MVESAYLEAPSPAQEARERAHALEARLARPMSAPTRILVADHRGSGFVDRFASLEDAGFAFELSGTLLRTLASIDPSTRGANGGEAPGAVVVLALSRPGAVELAAIERARTAGSGVLLPVLVVAPADDPEALVRADRLLPAGCWDLVPESTPGDEVLVRLRNLIAQSEREREMKELRHRASHDDRTDLLRPKAFEQRLIEHFSAAHRHHHEMAFVMLDLDRFGQINKQYDHTVGDRLIERVGKVIRDALRVEDAAGRLGGDEFAVILPYTKKIDAAGVVKRLALQIKQLSGPQPGARAPIEVSASIGFETYDGSDIASVEELRDHAERALRRAKVQGGNRGIYFRMLEGSSENAP